MVRVLRPLNTFVAPPSEMVWECLERRINMSLLLRITKYLTAENFILDLHTFEICKIPKLLSLHKGFQLATVLQTVKKILSCRGLVALLEWISNLTSLQNLHIRGCPSLSQMSIEFKFGDLSQLSPFFDVTA